MFFEDVLRCGISCTKYVGEPSSRDEISPSKDSDADAGAAEYVGAKWAVGQRKGAPESDETDLLHRKPPFGDWTVANIRMDVENFDREE